MKRLILGVLVAVVLAAPLVAQTDLSVSFTVGATKAEALKDALTWRVSTGITSGQPPTVNDAYATIWITRQCRDAVDQIISQHERAEAQAGGVFDVSGLTRAQRLQVKALIASFAVQK